MGELISIILIIVAISKLMGKAGAAASQVEHVDKRNSKWGTGSYDAPRQATRKDSARVQTQQAIREQIAKTKQRIKNERSQQVQNTTILQRAKSNVEEDLVDITLETMETEHNHSERVSAAVHHHPEDVMPETMLGNIQDLMIKGYDGNLCFERDFIGEAMDMISRFTVPSDVPDFSKDDVA